MSLVSRLSSIDQPQILIYNDVGACQQGVEAIYNQLKSIVDSSITIKQVDSDYLTQHSWEDQTIAFVMGGGVCKEWDVKLKDKGIQKIHDFVFKKGGKLLGFCAGAYFASSQSEFTLENQPSIKKERSLSLFSGKAVGPLFPTWDPLSPKSARAVEVVFKIEDIMKNGYLYYQSGCYFVPKDTEKTQTNIVAKYKDYPVAIHCVAGTGSAFLCGLHPEFAWSKNYENVKHAIFSDLAKTLSNQESFRQSIWLEIGKTLNLPMKKKLLGLPA